MQTYQTVADVIDTLKTYYQNLQQFYRSNRDNAHSERLQMLLHYISRHEKNIRDALKRVSEKDQEVVLKTWIQFVPFNETVLSKDQLANPEQDIESIVQQVFEIDDDLIRFYRKMSTQNGIPMPVKDFFEHLATLEEQEKSQVAEAAEQIQQL